MGLNLTQSANSSWKPKFVDVHCANMAHHSSDAVNEWTDFLSGRNNVFDTKIGQRRGFTYLEADLGFFPDDLIFEIDVFTGGKRRDESTICLWHKYCDPFLMLHIWRAYWRHSWHHSAIVFVKWSKKCRSLPKERWAYQKFYCCNNAEWDGKADSSAGWHMRTPC
jgi:hypothetical protein